MEGTRFRSLTGALKKSLNQYLQLRVNRRKLKAEDFGTLSDQQAIFIPAHFVHIDRTLYTAIKYVEVPTRMDQIPPARAAENLKVGRVDSKAQRLPSKVYLQHMEAVWSCRSGLSFGFM